MAKFAYGDFYNSPASARSSVSFYTLYEAQLRKIFPPPLQQQLK